MPARCITQDLLLAAYHKLVRNDTIFTCAQKPTNSQLNLPHAGNKTKKSNEETKNNNSSTVAEMGDRGHNRHRPKRGGSAVPILWEGGAVSLSNTTWTEPRSISVLSDILIHPAVWTQQTCAEIRGSCAPLGERLSLHLTQCFQG